MKHLLFFLVIVAGLAAVACGGGGDATATPSSATAVPEEAEAAPAATPETAKAPTATPQVAAPTAEAQKGVKKGGTFRRLWVDPPTLDPHLTSSTISAFIVVEIFSGLVAIDTDLNIIPDIAESWDISSDGTQYTFHLRRNVKFHDGKPVTARDFKWSFDRAANPATESPVSDLYLNDIVGVDDVLEGRLQEIRGVEVLDDYTLRITIDIPKAYFLAKLTYPTAYVLDRENVEKGGRTWTDNPNGTGPFKLTEYRIGERMVLERNENFYRGVAYLDRIVMNLAGGSAMTMYENDEIDITGVGLADLDRILDPTEPLNKELVTAQPEFQIGYIGFNNTMPPLDDVKFRQALNHAVDKELIAEAVLSNLVVPAYGVLPPGFPGYNPDLEGLRFDPQKAQQLLAESKYADPATRPRIVITAPGTGGSIGLDLEVVIEMWRQVLGVEVEIQQVEFATFLQDVNNRRLQVFALGWQADYPDPQDFLDILFHSQSSNNHMAYNNPEVDALVEQANVERDVSKRIELYNRAEQIIVNDATWLPLWYGGERHALMKPYLKDYKLTPMIVPKLQYVWIDEGA